MKKSYKIEVDCANCAQKMEDAANTVSGVAKATVSFMTQKMNVEFAEGADPKATGFSTSFAQKWKNKRAFEAFCGKTSWKSRGKGWKTSPLWGKPVESEKSAPKEA